MEELLIIVLQFLAELALNALSGVALDLTETFLTTGKARRLALRNTLWFIGGCVLAGLSLVFFWHTFITIPALRILNMLLAPIVAGFIAQAFARWRMKKKWFIMPRQHFWQAFWFTLAFVVIRFAFAARP